MFTEQRQLFIDRLASVLIAIDSMTEKRQGSEFIDMRQQARVNHLRALGSIVGGSALSDVSGSQLSVAANHFFFSVAIDNSLPWLGILVGTLKQQMGWIVVQFRQCTPNSRDTCKARCARIEWRCSKNASKARPSRSSLIFSGGMPQRNSAPLPFALWATLLKAIGL